MVSIDFPSAAMTTVEPLIKKLTTVLSPSSSNEIPCANGASLAFYLFFYFFYFFFFHLSLFQSEDSI